MADFDAGKAFEEAHKRGEHGPAPRWIPIAAATLALLAAVSGLLANVRVTQSLSAKSDSIIFFSKASDAYGEYEARSIKQHISEAVADLEPPAMAKRSHAVAAHEKGGKKALLLKATTFEEESRSATERSERLLVSHEILEFATTLFEVAIVLISIAALVSSRMLPIIGFIASVVGVIAAVIGFLRA